MHTKISRRSPSSPSLTIEDAVSKALTIYHRENFNLMHPDIAAQDIGYSNAANGSAVSILATLKLFGLLQSPAKGQLSVSKDIQEYKLNPDKSIRQQLLNKWLNTPKVYRAIFEKFGHNMPSDANLCHFLVTELNFRDERSALLCVEYLKASLAFVNAQRNKSDTALSEKASDNQKSEPAQTMPEKKLPAQTTEPPQGYDRFPVRLSNRRKAWIEIPDTFFKSDKELIRAQLDLIIADDEF